MTIMKFKLLIVCFIVCVFNSNAQSPDVWDLEKCINYAHDNNIRLKFQELMAETSANNLTQSQFNFLPSVNGFATHEKSWGKTYLLRLST